MNKLHNICAAAFITISLNSFAGDCAALSGRITVGASEEADYTRLSDAFAAINCGGVDGPLTVYIESGTYNERTTLSSVSGTSAFNTITIASQSGNSSDVIINYNTSDATMVLVGTSYITFEHLTFDHQAATYGNCVRVDGEGNHLRFKNVVFNGVDMPRAGAANAVIYFTSASVKTDIAFEDCEINNGSIGICKPGMNSAPDTKTSITGTSFFNQHEAGISLANEAAPVITSNVINTLSSNTSYTGIALNNVAGNTVVNKNVINAANSATGVSMNNCMALETRPSQIINNTIGISGSSEAYGIKISGTTDHQVIDFNTIKLTVNPANASTQAFYQNTGSGKDVSMMNSTFYDLNKGSYMVYGDSFKPSKGNQSGSSLSASASVIGMEKGTK